MTLIFPTTYFAPIEYYYYLIQHTAHAEHTVFIEQNENYIKQSYRNRCSIYGANGKLNLIIPVHKNAHHCLIKEVRICNEQNWQKTHWRSIVAAYNSSPFFQYYDYELQPFYEKQFEFLIDFNEQLQNKILELLNHKIFFLKTNSYFASQEIGIDLRNSIHPKNNNSTIVFRPYSQVFQDKFGFISNLSILDLLFNLGNESKDYLKRLRSAENGSF